METLGWLMAVLTLLVVAAIATWVIWETVRAARHAGRSLRDLWRR